MVWIGPVHFFGIVMMMRLNKSVKLGMVLRIPIVVLSAVTFWGQSVRSVQKDVQKIETYRYAAVPEGSEKTSQKRSIEMEIVRAGSQTTYSMRSVSSKEVESITIEMDGDHYFVSGFRNITEPSGKLKSESSIWRERQTAFVKRGSERKKRIKEYKLPEDKPLVVDGSLLLLFRSFPFDQNEEWKLFMIDFSQNSVSGVVRQAGVEVVRVEAGEFECYRMELTVHAFVFRPKITYWISKKVPHFLVKHRGKIGPFTRTYITQLVSIDR